VHVVVLDRVVDDPKSFGFTLAGVANGEAQCRQHVLRSEGTKASAERDEYRMTVRVWGTSAVGRRRARTGKLAAGARPPAAPRARKLFGAPYPTVRLGHQLERAIVYRVTDCKRILAL
jgi:hypothetical protein